MATQATAIPAFSPTERPDEVDGVGEDEEAAFEPVEEGLDWPGAVEEAMAESLVKECDRIVHADQT